MFVGAIAMVTNDCFHLFFFFLWYNRYIYWSSKSEPKIYRIKMNGEQAESELVEQYDTEVGEVATIIGVSLNFSSSGDLQLCWAVTVVNDER